MPDVIDGVDQVPFNGVSLVPTFDNADAAEAHTTQYFEVIANQGIFHDGWMANTRPKRLPWVSRGESTADPFNDYEWQLYNLTTTSPSPRTSPASNPEKLEELRNIFLDEATKNQVLPLDDRYIERFRRRTGRSTMPGETCTRISLAPSVSPRAWRPT